MGPLNSYRPGSVSRVPSVSEHDSALGTRWRRADVGALGQGLTVNNDLYQGPGLLCLWALLLIRGINLIV